VALILNKKAVRKIGPATRKNKCRLMRGGDRASPSQLHVVFTNRNLTSVKPKRLVEMSFTAKDTKLVQDL
jgi:hypothetical protein